LGTDVEIWMLFAPFWLLGIFAALGALWHFGHFSKRLHAHEMTAEHRHHLGRAQIAMRACVGLLVLGLVAGVLGTLWRG
jgi:hypothetical protein